MLREQKGVAEVEWDQLKTEGRETERKGFQREKKRRGEASGNNIYVSA